MTTVTFNKDGYAFANLKQQCFLCNDPSLVDIFTNPCAHGFHQNCFTRHETSLKKLNQRVTKCPFCDITLVAQRYIRRTTQFTTNDLSSYNCTICRSPLDSDDTGITTCGHLFHLRAECLPGWIDRHAAHPTCSDCRSELPFQGVWKIIRQYISYEKQQHLVKSIVALGVFLGAWTTILGAYLLSPPTMATGAIAVLSALSIDSINRNNLSDLFLSVGLLVSVISFTAQAYFLGIATLTATVYFQNSEEL